MAHDDDYRRRESNDYLNRQQDRLDFERAQRDRTSAVYDGIREKDEGKARWALDIPPADANSSSSRDECAPRPPTAGEQFREHSGKLLFHLKWSEALPVMLRQEWAACIEQLDIEQPADSLAILTEVSESYQRAARDLKPHFSDLSRAMCFETQVPRIGHEIGWLLDILNHVLAIGREIGGRDQE